MSKMKTVIKKDNRSRGFYHHKSPSEIKITHTKSIAMKDISDYCREEQSFYSRNYVLMESKVLKACSCLMIVIPIDTCIL